MTAVSTRLRAAAILELRRREREALGSDNSDYRAVVLPEPTDLQRQILTSAAKRKVVVCGRRVGKTFEAALESVDDGQGGGILHGQRVFFVSPSKDQTDMYWNYVKRWLRPLIDNGSIRKNETLRILEFGKDGEGGALRAKTGSDPDALRGFDADKLLLDECALLDPAAWYEVGAPMMADRNGTACFYSSPRRKNWFYVLYNRAIGDTSGRWAAWHATTFDNPHLSKEAVDDLLADMTEDAYKQEIMAEFLEGHGQVFRNVDDCAKVVGPIEPYSGDFVMGVDLAQTVDYTVVTVLDRNTRRMVAMDRFHRQSWEVTRERIRAMRDTWNASAVWVEHNSVGGPNIEELQNMGLPVIAFETTPSSKPPLIESLVLAFERREIEIIDDPVLIGELGAYERKVSPATGRSQYSAPSGLHDDCVMSLAIAWHGVMSGADVFIWRFEQ